MVDKNLFLYDLALFGIMKNEGPYIKEWVDYHLLAGVDHFYIYDNESPDNQKEEMKPYVDAGIVTYVFYPGKARHYEALNEVFEKYRFDCRYLALVDGDEFIFPKTKSTITEFVDEILSANPQAGGLVANWNMYGSNGHDKADYSKGVLDRFTRRAPIDWTPPMGNGLPGEHSHVKTIANPRRIAYFDDPHHAKYFLGFYSVNETGKYSVYQNQFPTLNYPVTADKIVINHYYTKSYEEYAVKKNRGDAHSLDMNRYNDYMFQKRDTNDEFDDGIVKYRDARKAVLIPDGNIEKIFPSKQINYQRLFNALNQNLMPTVTKGVPQNFYNGKVENFLTCLNLIPKIKDNVFDETGAKFFEEAALNAIFRSLHSPLQLSDVFLLIGEMPKILTMNYPAVKNIRDILINIIPQVMVTLRLNSRWQEFVELKYKLELFKTFKL